MRLWCILLALIVSAPVMAEINSFREAKALLKNHVYHDQAQGAGGTFYCGCNWRWVGESGGRVLASSCGVEVRAQPVRAERTEWEHVAPSWVLGHQRQCWQKGGRQNCAANDPVFQRMESDLHNLVISVGEINADRSNHRFGVLPGTGYQHGACDFKVDFKQRVAEPRDEVKGRVARIYFYMHDRYDLNMSRQQQQLLTAWDRQFPVSEWERIRDARIARVVGHHNPFVTGEARWAIGHQNSGAGLAGLTQNTQRKTRSSSHSRPSAARSDQSSGANETGMIRGNRNSKVFHLPVGCPSYNKISARNIVTFPSEEAAQAAGYRRAGNCR